MKYSKILLICILFAFTACSKGGDSPTPPTPPPVVVIPESDIAFKIEIDSKEIDYAAIFASIGATQAINVNVTSTPFPKDGVTIDVVVKKVLDNSVVSTDSKAGTTAATNALTISNLVSGVECSGTVTVTSKTLDPVSKTYKSLIKTFRIGRK